MCFCWCRPRSLAISWACYYLFLRRLAASRASSELLGCRTRLEGLGTRARSRVRWQADVLLRINRAFDYLRIVRRRQHRPRLLLYSGAAVVAAALALGTSSSDAASPRGTLRILISTPDRVPATVVLSRRSGRFVASKAPRARRVTVRLRLRPGLYRISPRVVAWAGRLYVGRASRSRVTVRSHRSATVRVFYKPVRGASGLAVTRVEGSAVKLVWKGPRQARFALRRSSGRFPPRSPRQGVKLPVRGTSALDTTVRPGRTYSYSLFTRTTAGRWSPPLSVTVGTPARPGHGAATFVSDPDTVIVDGKTISDVAPTASGIRVKLAPSGPLPVIGASLVIGRSPNLPGGYLGSVVGVSPDGTITLQPTGIGNAFAYYDYQLANFSYSAALRPAEEPAAALPAAVSGPIDLIPRIRLSPKNCKFTAANHDAPARVAPPSNLGTLELGLEAPILVRADVNLKVDRLDTNTVKVTPFGPTLRYPTRIDGSLDATIGLSASPSVFATYTTPALQDTRQLLECSRPLEGLSIPLPGGPVPLNLTLNTTLSFQASGKAQLFQAGVNLATQLHGKAGVSGRLSLKQPLSLHVSADPPTAHADPFVKGPSLTGTIRPRLDVTATLGASTGALLQKVPGSKLPVIKTVADVVEGSAGIAGTLTPLNAGIDAQADADGFCVRIHPKWGLDIAFVADLLVKLPFIKDLGGSAKESFLRGEWDYPRSPFELPKGCSKHARDGTRGAGGDQGATNGSAGSGGSSGTQDGSSGDTGSGSQVDIGGGGTLHDGGLDPTFGTGGLMRVPLPDGNTDGRLVTLQADGKSLVAGFAEGHVALFRYTADGNPDLAFGREGSVVVAAQGRSSDAPIGLTTQPDGKILLLLGLSPGDRGVTLLRFLPNGRPDDTFGSGGKVVLRSNFSYREYLESGGRVQALATDPANRILVLTRPSFGGFFVVRVTRLLPDGALDTSFGQGGSVDYMTEGLFSPDPVAVSSDSAGRVLLAMFDFWSAGPPVCVVVRYTADGARDAGFGSQGEASAPGGACHAMTVDGQDRILVGGSIDDSSFPSDRDMIVARFTPTGALDTAFGQSGIAEVDLGDFVGNLGERLGGIAARPDGGVLLGGQSDNAAVLVSLDANGNREGGFGQDGVVRVMSGVTSAIHDLALSDTGKVVAVGQRTLYRSAGRPDHDELILARLSPDGRLDQDFGLGGVAAREFVRYGEIRDVAQQADGKLIAVGTNSGPNHDLVVVRMDRGGRLDTSFGSQGKVVIDAGGQEEAANAVRALRDGKILVAGSPWLMRLTQEGVIDRTFGSDGFASPLEDGQVNAMALQPDGKIVVAGDYGSPFVARYTPDGRPDPTFGSGGIVRLRGGFADIRAVIVQRDGRIAVGGDTLHDPYLARLNSDGSLDTTFGEDGYLATREFPIQAGQFSSLEEDTDGRIVAAVNNFTSNLFSVVRLETNGTVDRTFGTRGVATPDLRGGNGSASALKLQGDGKIVVVGTRGSAPSFGPPRDFVVARLSNEGNLDPTFGDMGLVITDVGDIEDRADALLLEDDGRIVVGGYGGPPGQPHMVIARYSCCAQVGR